MNKSEVDQIDTLISIADAAERIPASTGTGGISANRLYFYCRQGRIGRKKLGRWMITEQELQWFLEKGRQRVGRPSWKPTEEQRKIVSDALLASDLPARDKRRRTLLLRYGLLRGKKPQTLAAIGRQLGNLSRERVRQLETEALDYIGLKDFNKQ